MLEFKQANSRFRFVACSCRMREFRQAVLEAAKVQLFYEIACLWHPSAGLFFGILRIGIGVRIVSIPLVVTIRRAVLWHLCNQCHSSCGQYVARQCCVLLCGTKNLFGRNIVSFAMFLVRCVKSKPVVILIPISTDFSGEVVPLSFLENSTVAFLTRVFGWRASRADSEC
jgi:hypothetical protein